MEIILNHVSKTIQGAHVLNDVNLELKGPAVYGLFGANGSGKTMLMRIISGLMKPTGGSVTIDGKRLGRDMDFPESMGFLIENPNFLNRYTGYKNLELIADLRGAAGSEDIRLALSRVGLDPDDKRRYKKYSLGMKQRLGIAAAIMEKPELILLDEPTNALDEAAVGMLAEIIRAERDRGALIVTACHDREFLESIADEIFAVRSGYVIEGETQ